MNKCVAVNTADAVVVVVVAGTAAAGAHIVNLCKIQVLHAVLCENLSDLTPNIQ